MRHEKNDNIGSKVMYMDPGLGQMAAVKCCVYDVEQWDMLCVILSNDRWPHIKSLILHQLKSSEIDKQNYTIDIQIKNGTFLLALFLLTKSSHKNKSCIYWCTWLLTFMTWNLKNHQCSHATLWCNIMWPTSKGRWTIIYGELEQGQSFYLQTLQKHAGS